MSGELSLESLVERFYALLYRFAYSLALDEAEACDLTQETFLIWATRGHQLNDPTKVKSWLFTTMHREFLRKKRKIVRFPHLELEEESVELPELEPETMGGLDADTALQALASLEETFRLPVTLFYLKECSYDEIASILEIPLGTVKSRISRGIAQLQRRLTSPTAAATASFTP